MPSSLLPFGASKTGPRRPRQWNVRLPGKSCDWRHISQRRRIQIKLNAVAPQGRRATRRPLAAPKIQQRSVQYRWALRRRHAGIQLVIEVCSLQPLPEIVKDLHVDLGTIAQTNIYHLSAIESQNQNASRIRCPAANSRNLAPR